MVRVRFICGLASVTLKRFSDVTKSWSTVKTWNYNGSTSSQSGTYTETSEGVFYYQLTIKDKAGNTTTKTSLMKVLVWGVLLSKMIREDKFQVEWQVQTIY